MPAPPQDYGWDHADTARYYEKFCETHVRYDDANQALLSHADIKSGHRILDFAAGTGRTAEAALIFVHNIQIDCTEPAAAMRAAGQTRLNDPRIVWLESLPEAEPIYDRILCGAAIWQITRLNELFRDLSRLLAPGGALVFNIPALYLGQPDPPGGGTDPLLLQLPAAIAARQGAANNMPSADTGGDYEPKTPALIDDWLRDAGLIPERWSLNLRLGQDVYRDWLKIPVISNNLLRGVPADRRALYIDEAFDQVDETSWRWENWMGWTARRNDDAP